MPLPFDEPLGHSACADRVITSGQVRAILPRAPPFFAARRMSASPSAYQRLFQSLKERPPPIFDIGIILGFVPAMPDFSSCFLRRWPILPANSASCACAHEIEANPPAGARARREFDAATTLLSP